MQVHSSDYSNSLRFIRDYGPEYANRAWEFREQSRVSDTKATKDIKQALRVCYRNTICDLRESGSYIGTDPDTDAGDDIKKARGAGKLAGIPKEKIEKDITEAILSGNLSYYRSVLETISQYGSVCEDDIEQAKELGKLAKIPPEQIKQDIQKVTKQGDRACYRTSLFFARFGRAHIDKARRDARLAGFSEEKFKRDLKRVVPFL